MIRKKKYKETRSNVRLAKTYTTSDRSAFVSQNITDKPTNGRKDSIIAYGCPYIGSRGRDDGGISVYIPPKSVYFKNYVVVLLL